MAVQFPVAFEKLSGTGNDFVVIDNRDGRVAHEEQPEFARKVCRRMFSVGADGMFLIEHSSKADFRWQFYNADGSVAEMCGNGARCVARFAYSHGIAERKMRFETLAGIIEAEIIGEAEDVRVLLTEPYDYRFDLKIAIDGTDHSASFVNTGVPHAVLFVEDEQAPVKKWGRDVRFHDLFAPAGTNANFVRVLGQNRIECRTYERGVEDETRACGTGATAAAIMAAIEKNMSSPVEVLTSGGDTLLISFDKEGTEVKNVYLQGPARRIYTGNLTAESLL
ncbi:MULTISPECIES: diaminopimelate epimerase [Desulfosediminicola]|uniref:diaminopimelate epimerase n=1 Tax=Desulfosediminicola TaxID=2886823 RepID=UPI0010ACAFFB|nr:diaminopimelate epimerase [Desulfosediminicola ganghwensis]